MPSLHSRERGLKYWYSKDKGSYGDVAPFAGAWIEIEGLLGKAFPSPVAPFAGAWIEIFGLIIALIVVSVAPFAGAWIEIRQW